MNAKRLTTPKEKVQQLQEKLGHAAKENKKRKFHALYDKIYRWDVLCEVWKRVKANKGAARVDAVTLAEIEEQGELRFLRACEQELKEGNYQSAARAAALYPEERWQAKATGHTHSTWSSPEGN